MSAMEQHVVELQHQLAGVVASLQQHQQHSAQQSAQQSTLSSELGGIQANTYVKHIQILNAYANKCLN